MEPNPKTAKKRSSARKGGAVAVLAVAALGAGVFASFTDTETATRTVDNGQLDIVVGPEAFSVTDIAPGDTFSRGMVIELPDSSNDGNLIEFLSFDLEQSVATLCGDVNDPLSGGVGEPYACEDDLRSLIDGNALRMAVIACPNQGQISDAAPAVDDDGDAGTNSRYDGPGPYTCSNGDFALTVNPDMIRKAGTWGQSDDGIGGGHGPGRMGPYSFGAPAIDPGRLYPPDPNAPPHDPADPPYSPPAIEVFADGTVIEAVTCIQMPSNIRAHFEWPDTGPGLDINDNDYENLSTDLIFEWVAHQRPGVAQQVSGTALPVSFQHITGCAAALAFAPNGPPIDPGDPGET